MGERELLTAIGIASLLTAGCREPAAAPVPDSPSPAMVATTQVRESSPSPETVTTPAEVNHPWTHTSAESLAQRYRAPIGFTRVPATDGSFEAFLRYLPLLPTDAKVVDWRGRPLYDNGHHPNIAAVVDIDVGNANLQQCADAVIRMNAEWRYGAGQRDIRYKSLSNTELAYAKWLSVHGEDSHATFRAYLDDVFAWANTRSLERDAAVAPWREMRAGDFFVKSGSPFGHTVLILDVAKDDHGRIAMLLGQSYMPAQSFQVLTPGSADPWFVVDADATKVQTPFWDAFPVEALHRL